MAIATHFLEKSFLPATGAALCLLTFTTAKPAQAVGFVPLNYSHGITGVVVNNGFLSINTTSPNLTIEGSSVTVMGGSLASQGPIGGAGYLYEATESGTVTFDWQFFNAHTQDFFGYAIFQNADQLTSALNYLPNLNNPANFPTFYSMINETILADGVSGSGQVSFHVEAGNIFGFGVALETADASLAGNRNLGNFTIANRRLEPDAVPTPAAVLPVLGGLFAAARKKKNQSGLEQD